MNTLHHHPLEGQTLQKLLSKAAPFVPLGLSIKYSILGLEARRRRYLPGRIEVGLHRAELSGAGLLNDDGKSLRYEILQDRKFSLNLFFCFFLSFFSLEIPFENETRRKNFVIRFRLMNNLLVQ